MSDFSHFDENHSHAENCCYRQGDLAKALGLLRQVAETLGALRAYVDLITGLSNLDAIEGQENLTYLAQAAWLCLRIQAPLPNTVSTLKTLYNRVPQGDELEALLATTAFYYCQVRGEGHPQLNDLQTTSVNMLANAAVTLGTQIDSTEALSHWMSQQQLNDPAVFLPKLNQRLAEIVGDQWVFDPNLFQ